MTELILRALGADVEEAGRITDWSLSWQTEVWGAIAVVLVVVLGSLAGWLYRKSPQEVRPGRRWLLTGLRVAFLAALITLLLQPVLRLSLEREVPRILPVLIDTSGSMGIAEEGAASRLQKVGAVFSSGSGRSLLASLENDLSVPRFSFAEGNPLTFEGDWSTLVVRGDSTSLGDVLVKSLERYRGSSLAGVVVVTDGGQNGGRTLPEAAQALKRAGVPVFTVGVGNPRARDVAIESVEVREVVLADDAVPVVVHLRAQGMTGGSGRVLFSLGGVQVAEEAVRFTGDGPVDVRTLFVPRGAGENALEVHFEADGTEDALAQNNLVRTPLRVVDRRLRVLLADQAPRWEYKYLEAMLLRERRVDLSCVLFEADREIASSPGSPYLEQFPTRPEDLFEFDLVILGDIDPGFLTEPHQSLLRDYVSRAGGALVVVAGKRSLPAQYQLTELARLLPVELAGTSIGVAREVASRPVQLALTEDGRSSVMMQLGDDAEASEALWQRLPPVYWTARVKRAKPAAEVLLTRPDPTGESETLPVVALQRYGAGEVLFIGTDNFWRWRRNVGDRYHATLWGQIIQRMAGSRLLTEAPRVTLQSEQRRYRRGDRVRVYARLMARNWEPRTDPVIPAVVVGAEHPEQRREVALQAVPGQPGSYRAEFTAGDPGNYRLALRGEEISTLDFTVRDDNREFSNAAMNEDLLRELAAQTGGAFFTLDQLDQLPAAITNRLALLTSRIEADLWSSPLLFAILVLLLTIEWIVRKYSELS